MWNFVDDKMIIKEDIAIRWQLDKRINFITASWFSRKTYHRHVDKQRSNVYYFLPFILGLMRIMFPVSRMKSFLRTVILIPIHRFPLKIYLNEKPFEPRERDYALVGSFYVFAIWIGLAFACNYSRIPS
jgi:hypothetical protein